ncbi:MAG: hypothetical protein LC775_01905 [Acidobacteria bacterium]|nr:hypothetical protein [Acidobacteriota bacterium]
MKELHIIRLNHRLHGLIFDPQLPRGAYVFGRTASIPKNGTIFVSGLLTAELSPHLDTSTSNETKQRRSFYEAFQ